MKIIKGVEVHTITPTRPDPLFPLQNGSCELCRGEGVVQAPPP